VDIETRNIELEEPDLLINPFMITVVLHLFGIFVNGKMMISRGNCDVMDVFNCSMTSFYSKGYYYHS
jgi:hypothetical protein